MKNKIIAVLADQELSPEQKYQKLSDFLSQKINLQQARFFQLGYSASKLEKLEYEVQKHFEISDLDIAEYIPETEIQIIDGNIIRIPENLYNENITQNTDAGSGDETQISELQKAMLDDIEKNEAAKEGLKIREQYPFLNDPNCPDEFKILIADKITAWKEFAKNHSALAQGIEENEAEEKLFEYAKSAVAEFQLNDDIRKELDFYRETGKVLGKNPKLANLKIKQEIYELTEAGLVEMKLKANKNASKAKREIEEKGTNENREKRLADWTLREKLSIERLQNEFNK